MQSPRKPAMNDAPPTPRPFVVAIDGPAASGKGTLARQLAKCFGLAHLETGALYRATALLILDANGDPADPAAAAAAARRVTAELLSDARVCARRLWRARHRSSQPTRRFAARSSTFSATSPRIRRPRPKVRCSTAATSARSSVRSANVKLFVTADPKVRAQRRLDELRAAGRAAIYQDVLQELNERDMRDAGRSAAPMVAPPDATIVDTTTLDIAAAFARASAILSRALAGGH